LKVPVYFIQGKYDEQSNYEMHPMVRSSITLEHSAPNTLDLMLQIINNTFKNIF